MSNDQQKISQASLNVTLGRRVLETAYPLIPHFNVPPTPADLQIDAHLAAFCSSSVPLESTRELQRREVVLSKLRTIFESWVVGVCQEKGHAKEFAEAAGGKIYTSGS